MFANSILVLVMNFVINLIFIVTFVKQTDDYQFNHYKVRNKCFHYWVMVLSVIGNMHFFRFQYSKILTHPCFQAQATSPENFYKPLQLYSLIYLVAVCVPNIGGNTYFLVISWTGQFWDN